MGRRGRRYEQESTITIKLSRAFIKEYKDVLDRVSKKHLFMAAVEILADAGFKFEKRTFDVNYYKEKLEEALCRNKNRDDHGRTSNTG